MFVHNDIINLAFINFSSVNLSIEEKGKKPEDFIFLNIIGLMSFSLMSNGELSLYDFFIENSSTCKDYFINYVKFLLRFLFGRK